MLDVESFYHFLFFIVIIYIYMVIAAGVDVNRHARTHNC